MNQGIDGGSVSGLLQPHVWFQLVEEGLDNEALAQQELVQQGYERELWIRAHSGLGKSPVVLPLLVLSSSLECTTKTSNFPLWGEKVIFLASWGGLLTSRKGVLIEILPPNPGVLIHNLAWV